MTDGNIVLPGFDCSNPECKGWTGTAKENQKVCRFCGTPRPAESVKLYRIRQTRWTVKYVEAGYDDEPVPDELPFADAMSEAEYLRKNYPTHSFEVIPVGAPLVHDIVSLQQQYGAMFQQLTVTQARCTELLIEARALKGLNEQLSKGVRLQAERAERAEARLAELGDDFFKLEKS